MPDNNPLEGMARPRNLTMPERTFQDSDALAQITPDDVARSRAHARDVCTPEYKRFLAARLDPRILEPEPE